MTRNILLGCALLSACAAHDDGAAATASLASDAATAEQVRARALDLTATWAMAQRERDVEALRDLYAPDFVGYDEDTDARPRAQWLAATASDGPAPKRFETVDVHVETWLDDDASLPEGVVTVEFERRLHTGTYPEHGIVYLSMRVSPDRAEIVEETRFGLSPGWDAADAWHVMGGTGPVAHSAAIEVWRALDPRGDNYAEVLASLGPDPDVTRPLARAVLEGGDNACDRSTTFDECDGEWTLVDEPRPEESFEDPCLRRQLAIWAFERGQLDANDLESLLPRLEELMATPAPEARLPRLVMARAGELGSEHRFDLARRFATARADDAQLRSDWFAVVDDGWFANSSDERLLDLYEAGLEPALLHIDSPEDRGTWLAALEREDTPAQIRQLLLDRLEDDETPSVNLVLQQLAMDPDCGLAMDAASMLARRGLEAWMPTPPVNSSPEQYGHALCMLGSGDPDETTLALWRDYIAPQGVQLPWIAAVSSEWDEDGVGPTELTRANAAEQDLPHLARGYVCVAVDDDHFRCESSGISIAFRRAGDEGFFVESVTESFDGCGC